MRGDELRSGGWVSHPRSNRGNTPPFLIEGFFLRILVGVGTYIPSFLRS